MINFNNKTASNQMRILQRRMRGEKYVVSEEKKIQIKNLSIRDMLKITRNINEQVDDEENKETQQNKITIYDPSNEEEKLRNYFKNMNVNIEFIDLKIYDNLIFWGGTVDGIIQFIYKVTPDEATSGVEFNYLKDFSSDNPENDEIIKKIKSYYDSFYKYWRNNILNQD